MSDVSSPSARDRADFERVLRLALDTPDIRSALLADPTGRAAARLRARALEAAGEIAAVADDEYRAYRAVRDRPRDRFPLAEGTLGPLLLVLTPLMSTLSAAVLLFIGYVLRLATGATDFATSALTAGWVLAAIAAVTAIAASAYCCAPPCAARAPRASGPWPRPTYGGRGTHGSGHSWSGACSLTCAATFRRPSRRRPRPVVPRPVDRVRP